VKGFHGSGREGLITPPSPRSLSADLNRPRQRRKRSSSRAGARSSSRGGEVVDDRGAEDKSSTTSLSTHPSLGPPYTPSLPDYSSEADADADADGDFLQKNLTDSNPSSKDTESVHRAPATSSLDRTDCIVVD
jgi:hypothetical protein